jgi:hypothetical protein
MMRWRGVLVTALNPAVASPLVAANPALVSLPVAVSRVVVASRGHASRGGVASPVASLVVSLVVSPVASRGVAASPPVAASREAAGKKCTECLKVRFLTKPTSLNKRYFNYSSE